MRFEILLAHSIALTTYLALFAGLAILWRSTRATILGVREVSLLLAALATVLWALSAAGVSLLIWLPLPVVAMADILRLAVWNGFLLATLQAAEAARSSNRPARPEL